MGDAVANGELRPVRVWRVSAAGRVVALLGAAIAVTFAVLLPVSLADEGLQLGPVDFIIAALLAVTAVPILVAAFRPGLILLPTSLVVVNPLGSRTLPLSSILRVEPEWSGLAIELADGETFSAWAVQKANLTRWLSIRGRADYVAAEVRLPSTG